jgi:hypothetical protein
METFLGAILGLLGVTALYVGAFRVWTGPVPGAPGRRLPPVLILALGAALVLASALLIA